MSGKKFIMKIFIYILMALSVAVIIYNFTLLNFNDLLEKESAISLIGILSAVIVIILLSILLISKKIDQKHRK